jgi:hypothetical protein
MVASLTEEIALPGGLFDENGTCHRDARVRPLRGVDEEWLLSIRGRVAQPGIVTALLSRCVKRIGPIRPTHDHVRRLTVGDRDFLMMQIRRMTFGPRVDATLICPNPECAQKMDATFDLSQVPVEARSLQPRYAFGSWQFRLPQGGDQEALSGMGDAAHRPIVDRLLSRCLVGVGEDVVHALPESTIADLESAMQRVAPWVDFEMRATCPDCRLEFTTHFDPGSFFIDELLRLRAGFDREVHLLSLHYHWPLHDILSMTRERRQRYLRCLLVHTSSLAEAPA